MSAPHLLRLVEYEGQAASTTVFLPGPIDRAYLTNLLGEMQEELSISGCSKEEESKLPPPPAGSHWQRLHVHLRAHGILTLIADLQRGRAEPRDLDARREVWAAIHHHESATLTDKLDQQP